eukprot:TRINITY_DN11442_c0_g1_i5.p1 TRINITY_DN11442_c0_g1~~TRINITY_DN11442_c0_g1_i5.p1  ORF type:complete len:239 (+),score=47.06 TRINITY_DN11442_c0_g1_i5:707-1423(+)
MGTSSEMWFHPKNAGAPAHMDPHCHTTVSFCFSGKRRWRMMMPPEDPHPQGYFDGDIYGRVNPSRRGEWTPTFTMEAPAGSAVLVYPGMIHETLSIGEECSSSISQTFAAPIPAAYYRAFWPRFAKIGEDVGRCGYMVEHLATLGSGQAVGDQAAAATFVGELDANRDGEISEAELPEQIPNGNEEMRTVAEFVSFHDTNRDGKIQVQEVADSWHMYANADVANTAEDAADGDAHDEV